MTQKVLSSGAEATILELSATSLCKLREKKRYRHSLLDAKLRRMRTKREVKVLKFLYEQGIAVPRVFAENYEQCSFDLEYIHGESLKACMSQELLVQAFDLIIALHNAGVVHGDLTTLNMLHCKGNVVFIDFGLAEFTHDIEKKAVDLHVFFICLKNNHENYFHLKEKLLKQYGERAQKGENIVQRLSAVERRGRNKGK